MRTARFWAAGVAASRTVRAALGRCSVIDSVAATSRLLFVRVSLGTLERCPKQTSAKPLPACAHLIRSQLSNSLANHWQTVTRCSASLATPNTVPKPSGTRRDTRGMPPTLLLRRADASDHEFLFELHVATMRDYVTRTWGWDDAQQRSMFDQRFDPTKVEVIELDGRPIGMQVVNMAADSIELGNIEILPEHQGRGYGSELIGKVLQKARATRRQVRLQVLKVNPASALYMRLGFVLTGETQTHYVMAWRHSDVPGDASST